MKGLSPNILVHLSVGMVSVNRVYNNIVKIFLETSRFKMHILEPMFPLPSDLLQKCTVSMNVLKKRKEKKHINFSRICLKLIYTAVVSRV